MKEKKDILWKSWARCLKCKWHKISNVEREEFFFDGGKRQIQYAYLEFDTGDMVQRDRDSGSKRPEKL